MDPLERCLGTLTTLARASDGHGIELGEAAIATYLESFPADRETQWKALRHLQLTLLGQAVDHEVDLEIQDILAERMLLLDPSPFRPAVD